MVATAFRDYDDPESVVSAVLRLPRQLSWPWRAGRRYTTIYRLDVADIMDCGHHMQLHLDPEAQVRFEHQLADAVIGEVEFDSLTTHTDTKTAMRPAGFEPTGVVSPRLMSCTSTVTLFPGASPIPAGLPFLWSAGLHPRRLAGRLARTMPLPH
ncbi:hypothetical protein R4P64_32950 [Rhodococcus sp. IEGM 1366]|uniref:hypothetical protein n=1 Tax=Rhodococcus sp. IEGM 1366 TaxID=3082223 RepID=UPI002952C0D7|nr:hypothetical protein [Rhodococcus sp. IEGM 1366]MDV8071321.1 hypothetical protein [Rhodococcus sp. IEGM 1366]